MGKDVATVQAEPVAVLTAELFNLGDNTHPFVQPHAISHTGQAIELLPIAYAG